jgi:hypothetical protein
MGVILGQLCNQVEAQPQNAPAAENPLKNSV